MVIEEIPVFAWQVFDIWSHRNEATTRLETAQSLPDGAEQMFLAGQVFKKITGENHIQRMGRQGPFGGAALAK
jgi:hypothetical protein